MKGGQVSCGMDGTMILNGTTSTLTSSRWNNPESFWNPKRSVVASQRDQELDETE